MKDRILFPPLYHPTSILLVDDNPRFLSTFRLQIRTRTPLYTFESALQALESLEAQADMGRLEPDDAMRRLSDPKRFELCATLIVDHDMPEMTGLEMCRRLANRPINRILLTGKVDESHAVEAFNQGLIHRFVRKSDPEVGARINEYLGDLNRDYFRRLTTPYTPPGEHDTLALFYTEGLARAVDRLYERLRLVEHYYVAQPPGLLLLDDKGKAWLMLLFPRGEAKVHLEIAESENAPEALLRALEQGDRVPFFPSSDGYFRKEWADDWERYLHPGQALEGVAGARYVLLEPEAVPSSLLDGVVSFSGFRAARKKAGARAN